LISAIIAFSHETSPLYKVLVTPFFLQLKYSLGESVKREYFPAGLADVSLFDFVFIMPGNFFMKTMWTYLLLSESGFLDIFSDSL